MTRSQNAHRLHHRTLLWAWVGSAIVHAALMTALWNVRAGAATWRADRGNTALILPVATDAWTAPPPTKRAEPEPETKKGDELPQPDPPAEQLAQEQTPEWKDPLVRPGIDDSDAKTDNWLGAAKATEHHALRSEVDQAAFSREPGSPGPRAEAESAETESPSPSETDSDSTAVTPEGAVGADAAQSGGEASGEDQMGPRGLDAEDRMGGPEDVAGQESPMEEPTSADESLARDPRPPTPSLRDLLGLPEQEPTVASETIPARSAAAKELRRLLSVAMLLPGGRGEHEEATRQSQGASGSGAGGDERTPGNRSDAESIATSREISMTYKPGMPLAGQGLRINTVQPRFSVTARITRPGRDPVVMIKFNRAGEVVDAKFADGIGTGAPDIDEPILDAVYRWTATGKLLGEIPAGKADAGVVVRIAFLLRG